MPARTLLSSEQRTGCSRFRPTRPPWRGTTCSTPPISPSSAPGGVPATDSASPSSFASSAIPAACWTQPRSPPAPMLAFVAKQIGADPALFGEYAPPGRDAPRAFARTPKVPGPPQLRSRRLACVPSDRHGCRLGHGSRRAHRPGDARPSPGEQRPSAFGDGVGADRAGRPCTGTEENLRGARGRDDRRRAGHAGGIAGGRSGTAPVALRLAAGLFGVARALEHRRAAGSPRIRARAGNRPGTRRTHPYHPPRPLDRRRGDHDRPAHRRSRTGAANGNARGPGREPRNPADRRDARHVREIHGHVVQPGTQPRREAFPGDPARRRQSSDPVPPHHRRPPAREGRRRGRRRRRRARDRHGATRRRAARHRCRRRRRGSGHPRHGGRAIFGAASVQPALPRRVRLPVEHAERSRSGRRRIFSAPWTATAPARCPNGRRRHSCRRNGAS